MTNFLPAGIINDRLEEIGQKLTEVKACLTAGNMEQMADEIEDLEEITRQIRDFMNQFTCQPLVYTGSGSTEEIINRLEWALIFSEGIDPEVLLKVQQDLNRKKSGK